MPTIENRRNAARRAGEAGLSKTKVANRPNDVTFFASATQFHGWLRQNHGRAKELWVGYYCKHTGRPSMTWQESVDEALGVGWIDGVRKRIDEDAYTIRFTPRRKGSIWSKTNIRRVQVLTNEKRMQPAGLKAFALRIENKSAIYSYEQRSKDLPRAYALEMRRNQTAWKHF